MRIQALVVENKDAAFELQDIDIEDHARQALADSKSGGVIKPIPRMRWIDAFRALLPVQKESISI